jgi:diguanylate cyclase (GGDEF)-like protein
MASLVYIICGVLSFAGLALPIERGANVAYMAAVSSVSVVIGTITWFLPWNSWPRWSTHAYIPVGFGLIGLGIGYSGDYAYVFGLIFCASFAVIGISHRRGTAMAALPVFVAAYAIPIGLSTGDMPLALSFALFIGVVCLMVAESLGWIASRLQRSQSALVKAHAAVNDISADLTSMDAAGLAWSASTRLARLLEVPDVTVYNLAQDGALECLASIVDHEPRHDCMTKHTNLASWDAASTAVATGEQVLLRDASTTLVIPLVARGRAVGIVEVTEGRPRRTISADKVADALSVCRLIALSIQDAQALAAEREQASRLASMLESSRAVTSADSLEDALAIVTRGAAEVLAVCECVAYEYMCEVDAIIPRAMWERSPTGWDRLGEVMPLSDHHAERQVLVSGTPLLESISDPDLDPASRASLIAWKGKTCLTVPMRSAEGSMGLLALWDSEQERHFTDDEIALAVGLAELAGEAVRRARLVRSLQRLSGTDSLTGLANHRQIHELLAREQARIERHGSGFGLVMLDIDGFKLLNDTYGHPCGDSALRHVAAILQANARASDVVGRYGGDEFVLILSETSPTEATVVIEKMRTAIAEKPFVTPTGEKIPINASFGIALCPQDGHGVNELVVAADSNLYVSKRRGGNAVTGSGHTESQDGSDTNSFGILESMVTAVDNKDKYTRHHSDEVTNYALTLGAALGLSEASLRVVRAGGLLHDVGKIGIPDRILRKPGRLTPEEWSIVKSHPSMGETLIRAMPDLCEIQALVASHHERFDGAGYPQGLAGADIPVLARILAVADAFSAMTTDRPYRKALTLEKAISELRTGSGGQFDPGIVGAFIQCLERKDEADLAGASEIMGEAPQGGVRRASPLTA